MLHQPSPRPGLPPAQSLPEPLPLPFGLPSGWLIESTLSPGPLPTRSTPVRGPDPAESSPLLRPENIVHQTMKTPIPRATSTSTSSRSIAAAYVRRAAAALDRRGQAAAAATVLLALALAVGCTTVRLDRPSSPPTPPAASVPASPAPEPAAASTIVQPASRWVPAAWDELPGWQDDRLAQALPALRRQCDAHAAAARTAGSSAPTRAGATVLAAVRGDGWSAACADLARLPQPVDDAAVRAWLTQRFEPHRVEALDGKTEGLATGYYEPLLEASRKPHGARRHALHRPPASLVPGQPWYTRKETQTLPAAQAALRGREIAYVADPVDVLVVQIQGSGRVAVTEPDGRRTLARLAFAAHNDRPYQSVGRWLIDQGELKRDGASWPAIRDWARRNPGRVNEMLWANPRLVFFHEEPLPDTSVGPRGAQGVPLTAERSIAVDPRSIPYGTPVWLDTTEPSTVRPLRRLVMAQDTGSAIVGAVRADYFWGAGERAEREAGRMRQALRMWVLVPKSAPPAP